MDYEAHQQVAMMARDGDAINLNSEKCRVARRSVDWRDSGIVIDEDQLTFNSIESLCASQASSSSAIANNACQMSHEKVLSCNATDQDDDGDTILHLAVVGCTTDKVKDLLRMLNATNSQYLNTINNMMQTPVHVATMANRPEMVSLLIKSGCLLNMRDRRGNTPLHLACQKGFNDIASIILDSIKLGYSGEKLTVKQYLELVNFDGQTCLHAAAAQDQRQTIDLLVNKYRADINCQDSRSGATIIHMAISSLNVDLVEFITSFRPHCDRPDYSGRYPLDAAQLILNSRLEPNQAVQARMIYEKLMNRVKLCIEQDDFCCRVSQYKKTSSPDSSSSSGSDFSDSDSDMY